jgi:hypothetical protein
MDDDAKLYRYNAASYSRGFAETIEMTLHPISRSSFILTTVILNALVFLGSYVSEIYWYLFPAEYLTTVGLVVQIALVYRREADFLAYWPWRFWYALGMGGLTYLFLSSVYVPSPTPFQADVLLRTDQVIIRHYAIFLIGLLPVLVSCSLAESSGRTRESMVSALVRRIR